MVSLGYFLGGVGYLYLGCGFSLVASAGLPLAESGLGVCGEFHGGP